MIIIISRSTITVPLTIVFNDDRWAAETTKDGPTSRQEPPRTTKDGPRAAQEPPRGPRARQEDPRRPREGPRSPKHLQKPKKTNGFYEVS